MNYVGAYVVKIMGTKPTPKSGALDGIIFSGGIGEKSVELRKDLGDIFGWLGVEIDDKKNSSVGKGDEDRKVWEITKDGAKLKVFVCLTVSVMVRDMDKQY